MLVGQEGPDAGDDHDRRDGPDELRRPEPRRRSTPTRRCSRRSPRASRSSRSATASSRPAPTSRRSTSAAPDQQKVVGKLSGGERNRVHLAKLLQSGGNVLLLDEPTNDLDVDTLRALEAGLESFPGCVVVISHDRWFLDRIATHILAFEGDSQVRWFEGNCHRLRGVPPQGAGLRRGPAAPDQVQAARRQRAAMGARTAPHPGLVQHRRVSRLAGPARTADPRSSTRRSPRSLRRCATATGRALPVPRRGVRDAGDQEPLERVHLRGRPRAQPGPSGRDRRFGNATARQIRLTEARPLDEPAFMNSSAGSRPRTGPAAGGGWPADSSGRFAGGRSAPRTRAIRTGTARIRPPTGPPDPGHRRSRDDQGNRTQGRRRPRRRQAHQSSRPPRPHLQRKV